MNKEYFVKPEEITRPPTHPGLLFAEEILPALGRRTIGEIATLLGVSRQTLHRVMAGESAITPDMAVRLGKLCGNGPDLWLRMQAAYDGWEASKRLKREIEKIPVLR
jgi:antitoxin HigA-1